MPLCIVPVEGLFPPDAWKVPSFIPHLGFNGPVNLYSAAPRMLTRGASSRGPAAGYHDGKDSTVASNPPVSLWASGLGPVPGFSYL